MNLLEDMTLEQCARFGDELAMLMAKGDRYLADWFIGTAANVMFTEVGMIPFKPENRVTLAEVERRVSQYVSDPALLPIYLEVIEAAIAGGMRNLDMKPPNGWRWDEDAHTYIDSQATETWQGEGRRGN